MTIKRLIHISIFTNIPYPSMPIDVLADVITFGVDVDMTSVIILDVDMLTDMEIIVMATPAITLEFVVEVVYAVDVLADLLLTVIMIDVVPAVDVDMFDDENADGLAAAMTLLEFTLPAS